MTRSSLPLNTFDRKTRKTVFSVEQNDSPCQSMVQSAIGKKSDKSDMYSMVLSKQPNGARIPICCPDSMVCQMVILLPLNLGNHRYIKLQKLDVKQPEGSEKQVPTGKQNQTSLAVE